MFPLQINGFVNESTYCFLCNVLIIKRLYVIFVSIIIKSIQMGNFNGK